MTAEHFRAHDGSMRLPEGAIRLPDLTIGGKTPKQLESALSSGGVNVTDFTKEMLRSRDFTTLSEEQALSLVRVTAWDLGLGSPSRDHFYSRANEFGLDLCPAEVGPRLALAYKDQPVGELLTVGMKQITLHDYDPYVFKLERREDGLWLDSHWAGGQMRRPDLGWVFSLRK